MDSWAGGKGNKGEPNIVYRTLTHEDMNRLMRGESLQGKAINGKWSAAEHVANQPLSRTSSAVGGPMSNSPWISTTKNLEIAKSYDSVSAIVAIDLNKVVSTKVEVWQSAPRTNGINDLPYHRSIWAEKVTIYKEIQNSAIVGKVK